MWIKASGTCLAQALDADIFVPVDLDALSTALSAGLPQADQPQAFTLGGHSLRPSIETSLHAVFPQRVVVHVHCVETIAVAIRADAETVLQERLQGFGWALVPYAKPGAALARCVAARLAPGIDVIVLQNHGLIVAADSVAAAEALLDRVQAAIAVGPRPSQPPDTAALAALAGDAWEVPADPALHQVALDPDRVRQATGGSLYPDHVVFCGIGAVAVTDSIPPDLSPMTRLVLVPGAGVLLRRGASAAAHALARCLSDVLLRVPGDARLTYLSAAQVHELLDWDAEKYRMSLHG
jgi:rhamnose utilization protein RhaD (predicted bifunctional aldolase and dehydrogenase)